MFLENVANVLIGGILQRRGARLLKDKVRLHKQPHFCHSWIFITQKAVLQNRHTQA